MVDTSRVSRWVHRGRLHARCHMCGWTLPVPSAGYIGGLALAHCGYEHYENIPVCEHQ